MQNLPPSIRHPILTIRGKLHAARLKKIQGALNELKVLKGFREAYPLQNALLTSSLAPHISQIKGRNTLARKLTNFTNLLSSMQKACGSEDCFYSCLNALSSPAAASFTIRHTELVNGVLKTYPGREIESFFSTLAGIGRTNSRTVEFGFVSGGKGATIVKINGEWEIKGNPRIYVPSEDNPHYFASALCNVPVLTGA